MHRQCWNRLPWPLRLIRFPFIAYCKECRSLRLAEEAFDKKSYENQPIYVQKLTEKDQHNYTVDESKKNTDDEAIDELEEISVTGSKAFLKHQVRKVKETLLTDQNVQ